MTTWLLCQCLFKRLPAREALVAGTALVVIALGQIGRGNESSMVFASCVCTENHTTIVAAVADIVLDVQGGNQRVPVASLDHLNAFFIGELARYAEAKKRIKAPPNQPKRSPLLSSHAGTIRSRLRHKRITPAFLQPQHDIRKEKGLHFYPQPNNEYSAYVPGSKQIRHSGSNFTRREL